MTAEIHAETDGRCPDTADLHLLARWDALQSGFRRLTDQLLADVEARSGLAPSSFQALWFLMTTPERSAPMYRLAGTLGFTTAGTTKVADRLTEAGLIERRPCREDRRVTLAVLTERGLQVAMTAALTLADALRERVVGPLGGAERFDALAVAVTAVDPEPPSRPPCGG
ncbi:MarR family winged helix-turn-helix transcriptional regulator [Streptomyces sp. PA03-1a]|nr:MarR family winged helix-turn-helix transcriptional regulator [Streptomyces sp. PA03-1a]MDX2811801.1 MarR family winged helix-turn-helix transcriptional regulator [Streptomyces sp. PA03-5A]